jgi:hypothetical protein
MHVTRVRVRASVLARGAQSGDTAPQQEQVKISVASPDAQYPWSRP